MFQLRIQLVNDWFDVGYGSQRLESKIDEINNEDKVSDG